MMKIQRSYRLTKASFQWILAPVQWANEKVKKYGKEPYLLGLFIYVSYMVPYFTPNNSMKTILIITSLRGIGIVLCTLLLLESIWSKFLLPYFNFFYFIMIFYCVPFVSIMSSFNDPEGYFTVMNIVLSMILLMTLVDWRTFLLMEGISLFVSLGIHKVWYGRFLPIFEVNRSFVLGMSIFYTFIVCILFVRKKQMSTLRITSNLLDRNKLQELQLRLHTDSQHQLTDSLDKKSSMMVELQNVAKVIRKFKDKLAPESALRIENAVEHLYQMGQMSMGYLPINPVNTSLGAMLQKVAHALVKEGINPTEKVEMKLLQQQSKIVCDAPYIENLIYNSLVSLIKKYPNEIVTLLVQDAKLDYDLPPNGSKNKFFPAWHLSFSVRGKEVATQAVYQSKPKGLEASTYSNAKMQENARIVQAHYGLMQLDEQGKGYAQSYVLPLDIRSIRPKIQKFADEDLLQKTILDSAEDLDFIRTISKRKGMDIEKIKMALKISKHYHRNQKRKSGELFYLHPVSVARILLDYTTDSHIIVAALLHDLVEDTPYTLHQISATFGEEVTKIVSEVTNLYGSSQRKIKLEKQELFAEMLAHANTNKKSLLLKLADRLHNMRTLSGHPSLHKRKRIAEETKNFFVPIAQKLGLKAVEKELRALCKANGA